MSFNESAFGWDGLSTFIFSNILLLATSGLAFAGLFLRTLNIARNTKTILPAEKTLLIAGLRLQNNQPTEEFKTRLNRALSLIEMSTSEENTGQTSLQQAIQIIILGGLTGNNKLSEARAGADYLQDQGVDAEQIVLEDQSRHTLENLQNARTLLLNHPAESRKFNAAIISSRYHLYRVITLARGLNLSLQPVAAEDHFSFSFLNLLRLMKEAYYLHWYWSGKLWVFITVNKKSQARIS